MEATITPYELPDTANHSFFFVDAHIPPAVEAKLHRHDAWELLYVTHGHGSRTAGDTVQPFTAGDVALIPPSMIHRWEFASESTNAQGHITYLMVAFTSAFVDQCQKTFPELRNRMLEASFPANALQFGLKSAGVLRDRICSINPINSSGSYINCKEKNIHCLSFSYCHVIYQA